MEIVKNLFKSVKWKFAKSMSETPHWYIVRWDYPEQDSDFVHTVKFIRETGEEKIFFGQKYIYLDVGEWTMWTMGNPIHDDPEVARSQSDNSTFILNVAHKEGAGPDLVDPNNF